MRLSQRLTGATLAFLLLAPVSGVARGGSGGHASAGGHASVGGHVTAGHAGEAAGGHASEGHTSEGHSSETTLAAGNNDSKGSDSKSGTISRPASPSNNTPPSATGSITRPQFAAPPDKTPPPAASSPPGSISRPQFTAPSEPPASTGSISRPNPSAAGTPPASGATITRPGTAGTASNSPAPNTATPNTATNVTRTAPPSAADQAIARGQSASALSAFRAEQTKFALPPASAPVSRDAAQASPQWKTYGGRWNNAEQFYHSRDTAVGQLPPDRARYWQNPPVWVQESRPAYGGFSGSFFGSLLGGGIGAAAGNALTRPDNVQWAYSHETDPAYRQWHQDMQAQAEKNDEVKQRLAALDAEVATLRAQHAPVTDKLPDGVDPALVVAPHTVLLATAAPETSSHWLLFIVMPLILVIVAGLWFTMTRRRTRFS